MDDKVLFHYLYYNEHYFYQFVQLIYGFFQTVFDINHITNLY